MFMKEMLTPRARLMIGSWTVYFMGEGGYGADYQALMRRNPNLNLDLGLDLDLVLSKILVVSIIIC